METGYYVPKLSPKLDGSIECWTGRFSPEGFENGYEVIANGSKSPVLFAKNKTPSR